MVGSRGRGGSLLEPNGVSFVQGPKDQKNLAKTSFSGLKPKKGYSGKKRSFWSFFRSFSNSLLIIFRPFCSCLLLPPPPSACSFPIFRGGGDRFTFTQFRAGDPILPFPTKKIRKFSLTWQRNHRRPRPEDVHAGRVAVAQRRVQADVGQLAAPYMFLLRRDVAEDDAMRRDALLFDEPQQVRFAVRREPQQPQDPIRNLPQDLPVERKQIFFRFGTKINRIVELKKGGGVPTTGGDTLLPLPPTPSLGLSRP